MPRIRRKTVAKRIAKAFRDHVYRLEYNWLLTYDPSIAAARLEKYPNSASVVTITNVDDPRFPDLCASYPRKTLFWRDFLARGGRIVIIFNSERIFGHFMCIPARSYFHDTFGLMFEMPEGGSYCFDLWVEPEMRDRTAAANLILNGFDQMHEDGIRSALIAVRAIEPALVRYYRRMGFVETGRGIDRRVLFHRPMSRFVPARGKI